MRNGSYSARTCSGRLTRSRSKSRRRSSALLLFLAVPHLAGQRAPAERAVVHPDEPVPLLAEDQEVLGVDLGDDRTVGKLVRLRLPRQIPIHQPLHFRAAAHWIVLAPCTPRSADGTLRLMWRSRSIT